MSKYPIGLWRVPTPEVRAGKYGSVIEDRGELTKAIADSRNDYIFAESTSGSSTMATKPLALIGTKAEICAFLIQYKNRHIKSLIPELADIYLGISAYKPGARFAGLFPFQDFATQLFSRLVEFVPDLAGIKIPPFVEAAGIPSSVKSLVDAVNQLSEKDQARDDGKELLFVKFSYLPEDGMKKIATGSVSLADVLNILQVGGASV